MQQRLLGGMPLVPMQLGSSENLNVVQVTVFHGKQRKTTNASPERFGSSVKNGPFVAGRRMVLDY